MLANPNKFQFIIFDKHDSIVPVAITGNTVLNQRRSHIVPDPVASSCDLPKFTISCELLRAGGLTVIITMDLRVIYR